MFCVIIGLLCAYTVVVMLNQSMQLYNQMDSMLAFKAFDVFFVIIAGLMVLNESELYSWSGLLKIFGSAALMMLGVLILMLKHNFLKKQELRKLLNLDPE